MKLIQVLTRQESEVKWVGALQAKERELRGGSTTWQRASSRKWTHRTYPGWVAWVEPVPGLLVARAQSRAEKTEWQILNAFVGFLNRHFGNNIESITISFR